MSDKQLEVIADDDSYVEFCPVCGGYMEWADCWQCGGEGEFDMYDDDPVNYAPGAEYEDCDVCQGTGGYWECASLPHKDVNS